MVRPTGLAARAGELRAGPRRGEAPARPGLTSRSRALWGVASRHRTSTCRRGVVRSAGTALRIRVHVRMQDKLTWGGPAVANGDPATS